MHVFKVTFNIKRWHLTTSMQEETCIRSTQGELYDGQNASVMVPCKMRQMDKLTALVLQTYQVSCIQLETNALPSPSDSGFSDTFPWMNCCSEFNAEISIICVDIFHRTAPNALPLYSLCSSVTSQHYGVLFWPGVMSYSYWVTESIQNCRLVPLGDC